VITLVRFERYLLERLELRLAESLHFFGVNGRGLGGRVNAGRLDGDDSMATVLEELLGVHSDDAGLIRLRNVREDHVDHRHEHPVLLGRARVLDNG
jgi:hypothetical protein